MVRTPTRRVASSARALSRSTVAVPTTLPMTGVNVVLVTRGAVTDPVIVGGALVLGSSALGGRLAIIVPGRPPVLRMSAESMVAIWRGTSPTRVRMKTRPPTSTSSASTTGFGLRAR